MAKGTKMVGILRKHGTHYCASLRKMVKKTETGQQAKSTCSSCGKTKMRRQAAGIWHRGACVRTAAKDAWSHTATSAITVESAIRLKEVKDQ
ncbi:60S ribosomal protein L37a-like [Hyaena hyaena]|uniref:60S ribosomal protein L37a-like n=1 Tax=Hyaena hyaena TaxID=95912 RepID=UPI00192068D2|nr:60S ribosomal protein L37a-like [Hyaena hyaena]